MIWAEPGTHAIPVPHNPWSQSHGDRRRSHTPGVTTTAPGNGRTTTRIVADGRGLATEVRLAASATAATSTALDAFAYGPDGARFHRRSEWKEGDATRTEETYYAGRHEKTYRADGSIVERTRIGTAVVYVKATPAPDANGDRGPSTSSFEYLHRDHLGSVRSVTDESGAELAVLAHDPYGGRRRTDWTAGLTAASSTALVGTHGRRVSRGFTGHEHLDRTGLVHMNGRVYDPQLGRFPSPDPVVADPSGSQGWNLYSYVGNNPLSRTDPTGLIQAGAMCNISTYAFCMDGGGGGGAARTATVTTVEHVFGVHVYHTPVWRSDWEWVWVPSFESGRFAVVNRGHYEWISQVVPYSATVQSSRQVATPEQVPANEPAGGTFVGAPAPAENGGSPAPPSPSWAGPPMDCSKWSKVHLMSIVRTRPPCPPCISRMIKGTSWRSGSICKTRWERSRTSWTTVGARRRRRRRCRRGTRYTS